MCFQPAESHPIESPLERRLIPLVLSAEVLQCWFWVSGASRLPPWASAHWRCSSPPQLWPWRPLCSDTSYTATGARTHTGGSTLSGWTRHQHISRTLALTLDRGRSCQIQRSVPCWTTLSPKWSKHVKCRDVSHQRKGHQILCCHVVNIVLWNPERRREEVAQHRPDNM